MEIFKDMTGVFMELDSDGPRGFGRGFIYCKELGNVAVKQRISDPNGKWYKFDCRWDRSICVFKNEELNSNPIEREEGCFLVSSEVQNIKSEIGYEKECRDNNRTIAIFTGSGLVLEVYPTYMFLWHCHVGLLLHVKKESSEIDLTEVFSPLQPISFKAVALNCPNRFVSFSATYVHAHSRYRPCNLFFAQNVQIVEMRGRYVARTKDGKNIILLDNSLSLLTNKPDGSEWSIAYYKVYSKKKEVVYLSAFLTNEEEFNEVFESLIGNKGSEDNFEDSSSCESSCGEWDGTAFFRNFKVWDLDDDSLEWYRHQDAKPITHITQQSANSSLPIKPTSHHAVAPIQGLKQMEMSMNNTRSTVLEPETTTTKEHSNRSVTEEREDVVHSVPNSDKSSTKVNKTYDFQEPCPPLYHNQTAPQSIKSFLFPKSTDNNTNWLFNKPLENKTSQKSCAGSSTNHTLSDSIYDETEDLSFRDDSTFLKNPITFNEEIDVDNMERLNNQLRAISCVIRKGYKNDISNQLAKQEESKENASNDFRGSSPEVQTADIGHRMSSSSRQTLIASSEEPDHFNTSTESNVLFSSTHAPSQQAETREHWGDQNSAAIQKTDWREKRREDFPKSTNRYKTNDVNSARFVEEKYRNLTKRIINETSTEFVERAWGKLDTLHTRTIRLILFSIATDSGTRCAVRAFSRDVALLLMHAVYSPEEPFFLYDLQRTGINLREIEDNEPFMILICIERHIFDLIRAEQSLWNYIIQSLQFIQELSLPTS